MLVYEDFVVWMFKEVELLENVSLENFKFEDVEVCYCIVCVFDWGLSKFVGYVFLV